jgi:hypothetical protein
MKMMFKKSLFLILLTTSLFSFGQEKTVKHPYRVLDIKLHGGNHLYTGQNLTDALKNGYGAIEVRYGWQSSKEDEWASHQNYPTYGVGWYTGYIGNVDVLGTPNAAYGWINFPLSNALRRNQLELGLAMGLAYNLVPFDPETNQANDAIGAKFAVYFNVNIGAAYQLNRELDLLYGLDLTHFSNGRSFQPNYGLNMIGLNVGLRYHFNRNNKFSENTIYPDQMFDVRGDRTGTRKPQKTGDHSISIYQAIGTVQNKADAGTSNRYTTSTSQIEYNYSLDENSGLTLGFNYFVDPSLSDIQENPEYAQFNTTAFPGLHIGYDYSFWKLTIRLQLGFNLSEASQTMKGNIFMRPAVKYDVSERFYGQFGLKTVDGAAADWLEFGIGYNIFKF